MKLFEIVKLLNATVVTCEHRLNEEVFKAFSSDLMSDVLTNNSGDLLLITGLANIQTIRTAEISDVQYIVLVRNKKSTDEMKALASELGILLFESPYSMFKASGILYQNGLKPVY